MTHFAFLALLFLQSSYISHHDFSAFAWYRIVFGLVVLGVESEVAVANGVEAVSGDLGETEVAGDGFAINGEGAACYCAGAHGAGIGALGSVLQASEVAGEGFGMG